jgi:hypothetical protein
LVIFEIGSRFLPRSAWTASLLLMLLHIAGYDDRGVPHRLAIGGGGAL